MSWKRLVAPVLARCSLLLRCRWAIDIVADVAMAEAAGEMAADRRDMEHLLLDAACILAHAPPEGRARALWDARRALREGTARLRSADGHDLVDVRRDLAPVLDQEVAALLGDVLPAAVERLARGTGQEE